VTARKYLPFVLLVGILATIAAEYEGGVRRAIVGVEEDIPCDMIAG